MVLPSYSVGKHDVEKLRKSEKSSHLVVTIFDYLTLSGLSEKTKSTMHNPDVLNNSKAGRIAPNGLEHAVYYMVEIWQKLSLLVG